MFYKILENKTRSVLQTLKTNKFLAEFYLAGGTALALQFGHRKSIDLDFFCFKKFSNEKIKKELSKAGKLKIVSEDSGTLHVILNNVKLSFLFYPYKLIFKTKEKDKIKIADWRDIASMKISAISNRGSKKDFIDIYFVLKKISLKQLFNLFEKKYKNIKYSRVHLLKSLVYFDGADKEVIPNMLINVSWNEVKKEIKTKVRAYLK